MRNLLLEEVEYKIDETNFGVWRRYGYANGTSYHEFKSHTHIFGMPLVHYTYGRNPETGKRVIAKGVIAIGRPAVSLQSAMRPLGCRLSALFGLGQITTGCIAIGQFAVGKYVLAQGGLGEFVWSMKRIDPEAIEFFKSLPVIRYFLP